MVRNISLINLHGNLGVAPLCFLPAVSCSVLFQKDSHFNDLRSVTKKVNSEITVEDSMQTKIKKNKTLVLCSGNTESISHRSKRLWR